MQADYAAMIDLKDDLGTNTIVVTIEIPRPLVRADESWLGFMVDCLANELLERLTKEAYHGETEL